MDSADLEPPNYLRAIETTTFGVSENRFKEYSIEHLKNNWYPSTSTRNSIVTSQKNQPGPSTSNLQSQSPNLVEQDLYLSSDTDPFATDNDSNDPDFKISNETNSRKTFKNRRQLTQISSNMDISDSDSDENNNSSKKRFKRKGRREHQWRRNIIKSSRNRGKEYVNWKGKKQSARTVKEACKSCRTKCSDLTRQKEIRYLKIIGVWGM